MTENKCFPTGTLEGLISVVQGQSLSSINPVGLARCAETDRERFSVCWLATSDSAGPGHHSAGGLTEAAPNLSEMIAGMDVR
jgi:hypothetical protein